MVYIAPDGRVLQEKPFSIVDFFWGIVTFFQLFFRSLVDPNANKKGSGYSTEYRYCILSTYFFEQHRSNYLNQSKFFI